MSELLTLTAAQAAERVRAGELDPGEVWEAYHRRAGGRRAQRLHLGRRRPRRASTPSGPLGGVPVAVKDLFCTKGVPSQAGSRILEDYRPPYTATSVEKLEQAGAPLLGKTNQDEFAMGSSTEHSAYGPTLNPWDTARVPGRLVGRERRRRRRGLGAVVDRHGHGRLDPPARRAVRHRGAQAHVRRGLPLRDDRLRLEPRPVRPVHARRDRRGAAARRDGGQGPVRLHLARPARSRRAAEPHRPARRAHRRAGGALGRGRRRGRARLVRGDARPRARARRHGRALPAAARPACAQRLLPDRARRGVLEPRALRRRPLRLPRARRPRPPAHVHGDARPGLRRGGQAPDHARDLRALLGLLRRLLRPRAAGAHADRARLRVRVRALRLRRDADGALRRLRARREDVGPARDVPPGLPRRADVARRAARHLHPERALRGAARRLPARRARVQRERAARRRARARARDRLPRRAVEGPRHDDLGTRHRPRDPRPARHADEDVLRLRAVLRRAAEHAHLPGLPRACPARCRWSTRRPCTTR